jgi:hypothetical protein
VTSFPSRQVAEEKRRSQRELRWWRRKNGILTVFLNISFPQSDHDENARFASTA